MIKPAVSQRSSGVRTAAILVAVIAILYLARAILIPLAFAIILTLVLDACGGLATNSWVWARLPSVLLIMVVSIAAAGGVGWVIFIELVE